LIYSDASAAISKRPTLRCKGARLTWKIVRLVLERGTRRRLFQLRELDREAGVVRQSLKSSKKDWNLVNHRHEGGVANGWKWRSRPRCWISTATQLSLVLQQRAQFEHLSPCWRGICSASTLLRRRSTLPLQRFPPEFHLRFGAPA